MNLKPAGIKTVREAIERLMNGEVFYSPEGWEIIYDEEDVTCDSIDYSPFKVIRGSSNSVPINSLWRKVSDWKIEYKWKDNIGDGVLCWVSDLNRIPCRHDYLRLVTAYDKSGESPYRSREAGYRFATPLTLKETKTYTKG